MRNSDTKVFQLEKVIIGIAVALIVWAVLSTIQNPEPIAPKTNQKVETEKQVKPNTKETTESTTPTDTPESQDIPF
jgi:cytoskeletal protein RodZ